MSATPEQWEEMFNKLDKDGSGCISCSELVGGFEEFLHMDHKKAVDVAADILKECDKDNDKTITKEEFMSAMPASS